MKLRMRFGSGYRGVTTAGSFLGRHDKIFAATHLFFTGENNLELIAYFKNTHIGVENELRSVLAKSHAAIDYQIEGAPSEIIKAQQDATRAGVSRKS